VAQAPFDNGVLRGGLNFAKGLWQPHSTPVNLAGIGPSGHLRAARESVSSNGGALADGHPALRWASNRSEEAIVS